MYTHYVTVRWETNLWGEGKYTHTHKVRAVCIYSGSRFLGSKFNGSAVSPCVSACRIVPDKLCGRPGYNVHTLALACT